MEKDKLTKMMEANFVCPKCLGESFKVSKGYYAKDPLLFCGKCNLILTLKELKKKQLLPSGDLRVGEK